MNYRDLFDISDRHALVIGAGSGIGAASAEGLADFGARVVCADLECAAAEATAAHIRKKGGHAHGASLDITDPDQIDDVIGEMPGLDILVSTPAVNVRKPLLDVTADDLAAFADTFADLGDGTVMDAAWQ